MKEWIVENFSVSTDIAQIVQFVAALVIILLVIMTVFWVLKRFGVSGMRITGSRRPRLGIIDTVSVDQRRRLILIRRDNVQHLLMIGGANDFVVEQNIQRQEKQGEAPPPASTKLAAAMARAEQPRAHGGPASNAMPAGAKHSGTTKLPDTMSAIEEARARRPAGAAVGSALGRSQATRTASVPERGYTAAAPREGQWRDESSGEAARGHRWLAAEPPPPPRPKLKPDPAARQISRARTADAALEPAISDDADLGGPPGSQSSADPASGVEPADTPDNRPDSEKIDTIGREMEKLLHDIENKEKK